MEAIPSSLLILLSFPLLANAYTWQFTSQYSMPKPFPFHPGFRSTPLYSSAPLHWTYTIAKEDRISPESEHTFLWASVSFVLDYLENSTFVAVVRSSHLSRLFFLDQLLILLHTVCMSVTRAFLLPLAPAIRSLFFHRPTRVVTIPLSPEKSLGIFTPCLWNSLNVN